MIRTAIVYASPGKEAAYDNPQVERSSDSFVNRSGSGNLRVVHAQQGQLSRIVRSLSNRGYEATHELTEGWLNDGESATSTVWLDRGTRYTLRGTCDSNCDDLDLVLREPASSVDSDQT